MLRNYLLVALRNLLKHRLYSFINVGGLAVGLAACLLILLFVIDELSYEKWLPNADRLAVLETEIRIPGRDTIAFSGSPGPLRAAMEKEFGGELEQITRGFRSGEAIRVGDRQFLSKINYVDRDFFRVVDLPVVAGDRDRALADNHSIALTQKQAQLYFGDEPAVGKVITIAGKADYTVVAVLRDLPENTHLEIEAIALFDAQRYADRPWISEQWTSSNMNTYALLRSDAARARLVAGMKPFVDRAVHLDVPGWENTPASKLMTFTVMPFLDVHLYAKKTGYAKLGDINAVIAFSAIALLILVIACINFVNLATARAMQRAREVAMRKVLGATRGQLISQHLGEAIVTALVALVLAFALVELVLGPFNGFLHKSLALHYSDPLLIATSLALILGVGAIGGLYPAFYLSRFRPARVLKANQSSASGSTVMRSALVVFQFSVSIALIICTATVYSQTIYARTIDLGFEQADRLALSDVHKMPNLEQRRTLKREVAALPGVRVASLSGDKPPLTDSSNDLLYRTADQSGEQLIIERVQVDEDFFQAYAVKPLAGRVFSAQFPGDFPIDPKDGVAGSQTAVINQSMARKLGVKNPQDAVATVLWNVFDEKKQLQRTTIVGVVPDLFLRSLRDPITPLYYVLGSDRTFSELTVVVEPGRMKETRAAVEAIWSRLAAGLPMRSSFVEQDLRAQYDGDEQRGQMFAAFAGFAVLIACLGLFGLASFSAERRTKEIGMRKVLGASVLDIVRLLVWQFSRPVLIANLIAWPIAFVLMHRWLGGFRHSISITDPLTFLPIFGGAGLIALLIAWATTAGHAYRVARGRPGRALRYE
jgi:putative ABC transport system permease protein